jgi:hypothetical protein
MVGMAHCGVNYWLIDIPTGRGITKTEVQAVVPDRQVAELDDRIVDSLNGAIPEIGEHNFL